MMVNNAFLSEAYFQHSKNDYIYTVQKIIVAVQQVLLPITNDIMESIPRGTMSFNNYIDIMDDLNSEKGELISLIETVSHLSGDLEQHKNQTVCVLVELQSCI